MSSISSVGAGSAAYTPVVRASTTAKPAATPPATTSRDPDHDGDSDGAGGLDVKG